MMTVGIGVGFVLLVVPGLALLALWSIATPILIAEGLPVFKSLTRSVELINAYFWKVLLLTVLLFLVATGWIFAADAIASALQASWPLHRVDWIVRSLIEPWVSLPSYVLPVALYLKVIALEAGKCSPRPTETID